jgi:hypothetical protein
MSLTSNLQSLGYIYKVAVLLLPFETGGLGVKNGMPGDF